MSQANHRERLAMEIVEVGQGKRPNLHPDLR
jgi:hypothetical protein